MNRDGDPPGRAAKLGPIVLALARRGRGEPDGASEVELLGFERIDGALGHALDRARGEGKDRPSMAIAAAGTGHEPGDGESPVLSLVRSLARLALPGQVLLPEALFESSRHRALDLAGIESAELVWLAHGRYRLSDETEEGGQAEDSRSEDPQPVYEVGLDGRSPLRPPAEALPWRFVTPPTAGSGRPSTEQIPGWRPSVAQHLPGRRDWRLAEKLGEGGFGEAWLVRHERTAELRVLKFCFDHGRSRALRREKVLLEVLRSQLGDRGDIVPIYDWKLDEPPFYLEIGHSEHGDLATWIERRGGFETLSKEQRLEIVAQVATALAAAHSVGILHKDVKPSNILVAAETPSIRIRLADFGVGELTELADTPGHSGAVEDIDLLTRPERTGERRLHRGTPLYQAPELVEGRAATVVADIYATGVFLYQMTVGDMGRSLGTGWQQDVADPLLREVIAEAVDRDPTRRLDHASELASRLRGLEARRSGIRDQEDQLRREAEEAAELRRLDRRRRVLVFASGVLLAVTVLVSWQILSYREAVGAANREGQKAEQMIRLTTDLLAPQPARYYSIDDPDVARRLLDDGVGLARSRLADQPERRDRLLFAIASAEDSLGSYSKVTEILNEIMRDREARGLDQDSFTAMVLVSHAEAWWKLGDPAEALETVNRAIGILERSRDENRFELAIAYFTRATIPMLETRWDAALADLARAAILLDEDSHRPEDSVGRVFGRLDGSGARKERSREKMHVRVLLAQARCLDGRQDLESALEKLLAAHDLMESLEVAPMQRLELWLGIANSYVELGRFEEAKTYLAESRSVVVEVLPPAHPGHAALLTLEGEIHLAAGSWETAAGVLSEAVEQLRNSPIGLDSTLAIRPLVGLAEALWKKGSFEQANRLFDQGHRLIESQSSELDLNNLERVQTYWRFLRETGDEAGARALEQRWGDQLEGTLARQ